MQKERKDGDIDMKEDPVPMLMKRHFEYGLQHCVKSVHDVDLQRYEDFKSKYDPNFSFEKKGGKANKIQWPDGESGNQNINNNNKNNNDDDLDLYS